MISLKASKAWSRGQRLAVRGEFELALAAYREAAALAPGEARILLHEALALSALGRVEEAARVMARAKELAPGSEVADLILATVHYDAGDFAAAADAAGRALELVPDNLQAAGLKGLALLAAGDGDAGAAQALVARGLPGMSDAYRARVLAWALANAAAPSVSDEERAAAAEDLELFATVLDRCAEAFGERAGFEPGYALLCADGRPSVSDPHWYALQMRRFEPLRDAREELAEFHRSDAYAEDPEKIGIRPHMRVLVGVLMRAYGRPDEANGWLARALDEDPGQYVARFLLGAAAAEAGDTAAARAHLAECLAHAPGKLPMQVWSERSGA